MNRLAFGIAALLLGAWAMMSARSEGPAVPSSTGEPSAHHIESSERAIIELPREMLPLEGKRVLIDEARKALEAERQRLAAEYAAREKKLDETGRQVREAEERLRKEWGRLLARSESDRQQFFERMTLQLPLAEHSGPKRYVILDRAPVCKPAGMGDGSQTFLSERAANSPIDAFALERLATVFETPESTAVATSADQRLDQIMDQLQSLNNRFNAFHSSEVLVSYSAAAIVPAQPPLHFDPTNPQSERLGAGSSWTAVSKPANSKISAKPSLEQKLQKIADSLDGLSQRLSDFDARRRQDTYGTIDK